MNLPIWQTAKVLVCCCDWSPIINPPFNLKKKKPKKTRTHIFRATYKKYAFPTIKYSSGFIVYFLNSSKYLRTHFSHYRKAEAALCCTLNRSNGKKNFYFSWNLREHVLACTHLLRYKNQDTNQIFFKHV